MKKFGFTLPELILTLAIIGIVAAVAAPVIDNIIPDKNKVQVLKAYKVINDITQDLLNDPGIYWTPDGESCEGLACTQAPLIPKYSSCKADSKYTCLLEDNLEVVSSNSSSSSNTTFATTDGVGWYINGPASNADASNYYSITIDLSGDGKVDGHPYSSSYTKPDQFMFSIDKNGHITGGDPLTKAYLANRYKLNDKKADYKSAKNNT